MKQSIDTKWNGKMSFTTEINGHKVNIDASPEVGGENTASRPKELMMLALSGCTGMDVVSILAKMRVELDDFHVQVEADLTEEHPKHYTHMHIKYCFKGKDLPMDKLEKAIDLSQERYCGVSFMYKKIMTLTHEIVIEN